ncbi:phosphate ABC transporter permease PstA [Natronospirillum operosum]|uniref:Phosphate transport system permease protein PstA n=1 Tax=Natronospirillum operosum TaxID=2759953 RepID=A0A4Z0W4F4_9GAMM|nr:phosphate ABC transporter permease PstA [Natronospirillum operosum]TGG92387.1 phosphate ABC transporter permease PstA [Natronospirillum operosum]
MKNWFRSGTPWIWLTGGAVALCLVMVIGVVGLIAVRGLSHFWPAPVIAVEIENLQTGEMRRVLGPISRTETVPAQVAADAGNYIPEDRLDTLVTRYLFRVGNRDQFGADFVWHTDLGMREFEYPAQVLELERREWGNFYGYPEALLVDGEEVLTADHPDFLPGLKDLVERSLVLHDDIRQIERGEVGEINRQMEQLRRELRRLDLNDVTGMARTEEEARVAAERARLDAEYDELRADLDELYASTRRDTLRMRMSDDRTVSIPLAQVVRVTQPNNMSVPAKMVEYMDRFWTFVTDEPREANTEGGIFPALFGTVTMVIVMSIMVTPFGVLAAIYLREYARQGPITRAVRISVYNLAGVPSIVFGVFGLGFFVYFLGGNIDQLFFPEALPRPTFGSPGLFWASLTLALLTLPVVIVSTEEGLARIPSTIRQGSLALGATKSETLWKVVVPLSTPAMMTGLILAIARAAGEVAPLMLVGVVKLAPSLPIDGNFPYIHLERQFMHLGFHIYDVGFQSPNVEAARPLVYATALVLILLIIVLNLTAISIRNHLREKYRSETD